MMKREKKWRIRVIYHEDFFKTDFSAQSGTWWNGRKNGGYALFIMKIFSKRIFQLKVAHDETGEKMADTRYLSWKFFSKRIFQLKVAHDETGEKMVK